MTHEYTILYDTVVLTGDDACPRAGAVAYALDTILAVGDEPTVRGISRGDSRFIALPGKAVTVAPRRPDLVEQSLREAVGTADGDGARDLLARLCAGAQGEPARRVDVGAVADLAIWSADPARLGPGDGSRFRLEALVRGGTFDRGDPLHGPYALDPMLPPQCGGGHPGPEPGPGAGTGS